MSKRNLGNGWQRMTKKSYTLSLCCLNEWNVSLTWRKKKLPLLLFLRFLSLYGKHTGYNESMACTLRVGRKDMNEWKRPIGTRHTQRNLWRIDWWSGLCQHESPSSFNHLHFHCFDCVGAASFLYDRRCSSPKRRRNNIGMRESCQKYRAHAPYSSSSSDSTY